ncbi:MAG: hypothetical protein H6R07_381 [Proteobacteria bacterium]|nr:hypothetical protein [Pseudomonadota bacterium]
MNSPIEPLFNLRQTITLELPLDKHTRILHPEQVILKIADNYFDIGALCFSLRSDKKRKPRQPQDVVASSLLKQRPKQILQLIKTLSNLKTRVGKSLTSTDKCAWNIKKFIDWSDANSLHDCLAGGEATRNAFREWATAMHERYRRQELNGKSHNHYLTQVCELLEAMTGLENLIHGIKKVKQSSNPNGGTEPLALDVFVHAVALNQCLFDGLCDLVLEQRPFPYKLKLPSSLGWSENHLWLFPTIMWRLPPHRWTDANRAKMGTNASWSYDYENGRLLTIEEIEHRYAGQRQSERRKVARECIKRAKANLDEANADAQHKWRLKLGMVAQRAFLFLFFCNTGGNAQVVRDLETDGKIDAAVQNQKFRTLKWRADGKEVTLTVPVSFMPRMRRFMELRQYLLQGKTTPYLFFSCGNCNSKPPAQTGTFIMENHYKYLLIEIDPQLPRMGARVLRASVDDYYLRHNNSSVVAAFMGHSKEIEEREYARGLAADHHKEMTSFLESVSESAQRQLIIPPKDVTSDIPSLETGGRCGTLGHPEALAVHTPVQPDCKDSQGCLFCKHRVLIAGEEDARKVASAAYVLEQLILYPQHEDALRPLIAKCDEDLEKISSFPNCRAMVEKVRKDVYENENLTLFWADKYLLFLELWIIS